MKRVLAGATLLLLGGCLAGSARPRFQPLPEARMAEIELDPIEVTQKLTEKMTAEGMPLAVVAPQDGYFETAWFDSETLDRRGATLGPNTVKIRGWATPSRYGWSEVVVEVVYRALADPSLPERELERSVAFTHPMRQRVREAFEDVGIVANIREVGALAAATPPNIDPGALAPADDSVLIEADATPRGDTLRAMPAIEQARPDSQAPLVRHDTPTVVPPAAAPARDSVVGRPAPVVTPAVPVTPAQREPAPSPQPAEPQSGRYQVQVAAARDRGDLDAAIATLRRIGYEAVVVSEDGFVKVRTTGYQERATAVTALSELRNAFPDAFIVRR